ncbi:hypothetical protein CEXT_595021 [Caerostris extrusa]|uniref:Uncharacterized protein n=1 Tax=Caerostris extrusa TaxID=172846 RepID=A0AAV4QT95_CAEEX|nr:hypothetical protein CEXT_595021 [Caerostris extrusa]
MAFCFTKPSTTGKKKKKKRKKERKKNCTRAPAFGKISSSLPSSKKTFYTSTESSLRTQVNVCVNEPKRVVFIQKDTRKTRPENVKYNTGVRHLSSTVAKQTESPCNNKFISYHDTSSAHSAVPPKKYDYVSSAYGHETVATPLNVFTLCV